MMRPVEYYKKFIERHFSIVDSFEATVPFIFNPMQDRIINELTGMDIILKARRHGISSLKIAMMTVDFILQENYRGVIISHETKATQKLLDKVKFFLESMQRNLPPDVELPFELEISSRNELVNKLKHSSIYIGTAGAKSFGRGDQISDLHLSEAAFYDSLDRFLVGILPAAQNGNVSIETTAHGYNEFRKLWIRNATTPSPFQTHFIPWFENPIYRRPCSMKELPQEDEKDLMEKYKLDINQVVWRRYELEKLGGNLDDFAQEYPATAEEAFISSGNRVWSPTMMRWYMNHTKEYVVRGNLYGVNPVRLDENDNGFVRIWKAPNRSHLYVIGADVAEGKMSADERDSDYSCAQVIDQTTFEQVAVWHGRIDPDLYGRELDMLGQYYNNALLAIEKNSVGLTTLTTVRDLYYPNLYYRERFGLHADRLTDELGWVTDRSTKDFIISGTTQLLRDKKLKIYDEETLSEMSGFVRNANGTAQSESGSHDDRVMSLMIAIKMLSQPQSITRGNPIEEEGSLGEGMIFISDPGVANTGNNGDWSNGDQSWSNNDPIEYQSDDMGDGIS